MHPTLVTVGLFEDSVSAHVACGRLEAEGISAFVIHEHHISANWLCSYALGGVKVQVPESDVEGARRILEEIKAGAYALEDEEEPPPRCPRCGSCETVIDKTWRKAAFVSLILFDIPLPFRRESRKCLACRHRWTPAAS